MYSLIALCPDRPAQASQHTEIISEAENLGPSPDLHEQNLHSDKAYKTSVQHSLRSPYVWNSNSSSLRDDKVYFSYFSKWQ